MVCRDGAATVPVSGSRRPPRLASTGRRLGRPLRDRRQRVVPNRADLIEALAVPVTWSVRRTCWSGRPPATYWAAARPKDVLFRDTEVREGIRGTSQPRITRAGGWIARTADAAVTRGRRRTGSARSSAAGRTARRRRRGIGRRWRSAARGAGERAPPS